MMSVVDLLLLDDEGTGLIDINFTNVPRWILARLQIKQSTRIQILVLCIHLCILL